MTRVVKDTSREKIDGAASDVFRKLARWLFIRGAVVELKRRPRTTLGDDGRGINVG